MEHKAKPQHIADTVVPPQERIRTVSQGVNYKTGEGIRLEFDSWEEMTEYMRLLTAEDYDNVWGLK